MEGEEAVEIEGSVGLALTRWLKGDPGTDGGVAAIGIRRHHAETIDRAALEDGDEDFPPSGGGLGGSKQKARRRRERHECTGAGLDERAASHHGSPRITSPAPLG